MTLQAEATGILSAAREQVLERGERLTQEQVLQVLRAADDQLEDLREIVSA